MNVSSSGNQRDEQKAQVPILPWRLGVCSSVQSYSACDGDAPDFQPPANERDARPLRDGKLHVGGAGGGAFGAKTAGREGRSTGSSKVGGSWKAFAIGGNENAVRRGGGFR